MSTALMTAQDMLLNACALPAIPAGARYVDLPFVYVFRQLIAAGPNQVLTDLRLGISPMNEFWLRAVSFVPRTANERNLRIRYGRPGHYWQNARIRAGLFLGTASQRKAVLPQQHFAAGSKVAIEVENQAAAQVAMALYFEGVERIYLR